MWRICWVPILILLGFLNILSSTYSINIQSSKRVSRKVSRRKKKIGGWILDAKMGDIEKHKQTLHILRVLEKPAGPERGRGLSGRGLSPPGTAWTFTSWTWIWQIITVSIIRQCDHSTSDVTFRLAPGICPEQGATLCFW